MAINPPHHRSDPSKLRAVRIEQVGLAAPRLLPLEPLAQRVERSEFIDWHRLTLDQRKHRLGLALDLVKQRFRGRGGSFDSHRFLSQKARVCSRVQSRRYLMPRSLAISMSPA